MTRRPARISRWWWPLLFAALLARPAAAGVEQAGTTGASFLTLGSGAGVLGMGGASIGTYSDLTSVSWNVASLGLMNESQLVFSHTPLAGGGAQEWFGYGGRAGLASTRWAADATYQGDGSFEGRDAFGNPTGSFGASSMAFGGTLAHTFGESVTLGFGGKVVSEKLGDATGFGGTFDAGLLVQRGDFGFGAAAQNLGGRMKYGDLYYSMPTNIGVGVSYAMPVSGLRFALDFNHPSAYYNDVRVGAEWMWRGRVAVRTGYRSELGAGSTDGLSGPTFGMGTGVRGLWFDYGYLASSNGDAQHRIALRLTPGAWTGGVGAMSANSKPAPVVAEETPKASKSTPPETATHPTSSEPVAAKSATPAPATSPSTSATSQSTSMAPKSAPAPTAAAPKTAPAATAAAPVVAAAPKTAPVATAAAPKSAPAATAAPSTSSKTDAVATKSAPTPKSEPVATKTSPVSSGGATAAKSAPAVAALTPTAAPAPKSVSTNAAPSASAPASTSKPATAPASTPAATSAPAAGKSNPSPTPAAEKSAPAAAAPVAAATAPVASNAAPVTPTGPSSTAKVPDKVKVKSGETMQSLAQKYNTSVAAIMMENNLVSDQVKPGQVLKIPTHK